MNELCKCDILFGGFEVTVDDTLQAHQCEYRAVGMMCDEFALACQSHAIDAVRLEDDDGEIGTDTHYHERHKESVSASEFGYEEYAGEWCVHHSCHDPCHAQKGEVLLWHHRSDVVYVPQSGEEEAGEGTYEQRGCKGTSASSSPIGGRGGKNLCEQ